MASWAASFSMVWTLEAGWVVGHLDKSVMGQLEAWVLCRQEGSGALRVAMVPPG